MGTILLMLGYGYVLLRGANLIADGSELLLEVMDPGVIGTFAKVLSMALLHCVCIEALIRAIFFRRPGASDFGRPSRRRDDCRVWHRRLCRRGTNSKK